MRICCCHYDTQCPGKGALQVILEPDTQQSGTKCHMELSDT